MKQYRLPGKYRKLIRAMSQKRFGEETDHILSETEKQYGKFRETTPDIGGKANMQFQDLDFLIAFFAFYEACEHRIDESEFEEFAYEIFIKPAETAARFINWNSPLMKKFAERSFASYKKKTDAHAAKGEWGNTWRVDLNPEGHREGFAIHTRMCPNVDFCIAHGYERFLPVICAQDYKIAKAMHGVLIRTHTVSDGDDYCDWWYFGDKEKLPEEAVRRLAEKSK